MPAATPGQRRGSRQIATLLRQFFLVTRRDVNTSDGSRTRTSLIRAAKHDDQSAWARLVNTYGPQVYQWCRDTGLQPADASDVVQDVMRAVARGLSQFRRDRKGDSFRGWLRRITQRRILDLHRRDKRFVGRVKGGSNAAAWLQQSALDPNDDLTDATDTVRSAAICPQTLERVRLTFSERNWRIFWRVVVDEQDIRDVADEFGVTSNVVRLAKSRILKRLREALSQGSR